jgi:hypothetical protein
MSPPHAAPPRPSWERRCKRPADELPPDILLLLVSCGCAVRKTDSEAVKDAIERARPRTLDIA